MIAADSTAAAAIAGLCPLTDEAADAYARSRDAALSDAHATSSIASASATDGAASETSRGLISRTRLAAIVDLNAFSLDDQHSLHQQCSGMGIFSAGSFLNHSCWPNSSRNFVGDVMFLFSTRQPPAAPTPRRPAPTQTSARACT